ncbi:uroporphyrinogen-III synthase [Pseudoxanthomonas dokdonensis]|uniref:Uroporphyrinogen-III synthase n=1 Tax=Pseudoxanthomonas dokdonensis TaxID=344882 RepID=A0A0R0CPW4_9GAMM|nr:uroporphyrinogen-III synthase [Pseudoxanthomonas dokdonensis]KRG71981.1 hypothetical protein ABB29_00490 [Pseudoxanthomonas dokdonensis]
MEPHLLPSWYVISLRPRGSHQPLRRGAARLGAGFVALSPWSLQALDDPPARRALEQALASDVIVFTSPPAVRAAAALQPLRADGQQWLAVGSATAAALRRAGINAVLAPQRMDSEGLLALPVLHDLHGRSVGLVTAPDGRSLLAAGLIQRGAQLRRADVYRRCELPLSAPALRQLDDARGAGMLMVSSAKALQQVLSQLDHDRRERLLQATAVVASERLRQLAVEQGFAAVATAAGPRPAQLLSTAVHVMGARIR